MANERLPDSALTGLAPALLGMPWPIFKYGAGQRVLELLRQKALARTGAGKSSARGYALEVAVAADQWLASNAATHRFVLAGVTELGKDGQPSREWDVVRLDLVGRDRWTITAVECAITRSGPKDDQARQKLAYLEERLSGRFNDLAKYETRLATASAGRLRYEDAGRGWTML
jgi:hypothetical protein